MSATRLVLPDPEGPTSATVRPASMSRSISLRAGTGVRAPSSPALSSAVPQLSPTPRPRGPAQRDGAPGLDVEVDLTQGGHRGQGALLARVVLGRAVAEPDTLHL